LRLAGTLASRPTVVGYIITGRVISGNKIGRDIGFPTANIPISDGDPVEDGVWAGIVTVEETVYPAMINIGRNPTVGKNMHRTLEAHLLGFEGDLYDKTLEAELLEFIRSEQKFGSLGELKEKIADDKAVIEAYFRGNGLKTE